MMATKIIITSQIPLRIRNVPKWTLGFDFIVAFNAAFSLGSLRSIHGFVESTT